MLPIASNTSIMVPVASTCIDFAPAKKEISVALIDFMNQLRGMPELGEIAQQLATLFSQGVRGAAEALENAMPAIQKFLDYLVNNGPQVLSFLGKLAAAFGLGRSP